MTVKVVLSIGVRGLPGRIAPEDQARIDAAIEVSETIGAVVEQATEAATTSTEKAEEATQASLVAVARSNEAALSAATAAADASSTSVDRGAAEAARIAAEQAATSAAQSAQFYDTIAAGRAAVADGAQFGVRAGGADGLTRPTIYRRDSATTQTAMVTIVNPAEVDAEREARIAVSGTQARVYESGRWARSGIDYAEAGTDRRVVVRHRAGRRVYEMPVDAEGAFRGEFNGSVNGARTVADQARWARAGAPALIVGINRRQIPEVGYVERIRDPARWDRSGCVAALIGFDRRMVLDMTKVAAPTPQPQPSSPLYVPWSDGTRVFADHRDSGRSIQISQGSGNNIAPVMQDGVVVWRSDRPATGTYEPAALGGAYYSRPDLADEHPVVPLNWLCCLGDSTTAGGYMGQFAALGWSIPFRNMGRSGNTAAGIAARYWAVEVSYDCPAIPADASEVVCTPSSTSRAWPGEIVGGASAGINGFLHSAPTRTPSTGVYVALRWDSATNTYRIRRYDAGPELPAGKWFFYASPTAATDGNAAPPTATMAWKMQDAILLCLLGRNSATQPDHVFDMARAIWAAHKPLSKRIVMMPWIHGTDEPRGSAGYANRRRAMDLFLAEWPNNTLDLVPWLQAAATSSTEDQAALANDTPPPSLMSDNIHPGASGRVEMARGILDFCTKKGWR